MNEIGPRTAGAAAGEQVFTDARIVLADRVVRGSLMLRGGRIAAIDEGRSRAPGAVECGGDLVAPGLVELHTDNLERHLMPRLTVRWPNAQALIAHDGELAAAGITTVFDALRAGAFEARGGEKRYAAGVAADLDRLAAAGAFRIDHRIHIRAEVCAATVLEELDELAGAPRIALVSIMDHTPGRRQFRDMAAWRARHRRLHGMTEAEVDAFVSRTTGLRDRDGARHIAAIAGFARAAGAVLASHDDTTEADAAESAALGVRLAEFPVTRDAAAALCEAGIAVMMGAPNLLRGGSHSGNVDAAELVEAGLVSVFSSDYIPGALLVAALRLGEMAGNVAAGFRAVSLAPARVAGLTDRGEIACGKRADLIRVAEIAGVPVLRGTWVAGRRAA